MINLSKKEREMFILQTFDPRALEFFEV